METKRTVEEILQWYESRRETVDWWNHCRQLEFNNTKVLTPELFQNIYEGRGAEKLIDDFFGFLMGFIEVDD